jgi:hypothetical protein
MIAKISVGKTGITEKIGEISPIWKSVKAEKLGIYHVSKNPKVNKAAAMAEMENWPP